MECFVLRLQTTPVLQVTALDGDRGVPNDIRYQFIDGMNQHLEYHTIKQSTIQQRQYEHILS